MHAARHPRARYVVHVSAPSLPPTYYPVDLQKRSAEIVGETYPGLVDVPLGEVSATSYVGSMRTRVLEETGRFLDQHLRGAAGPNALRCAARAHHRAGATWNAAALGVAKRRQGCAPS